MDKERRHKGSHGGHRRDERREDRRGGDRRNDRREDRRSRKDSPPRENIFREQTKRTHKNSFDNLHNIDEERDRTEKQVILEKSLKALFK